MADIESLAAQLLENENSPEMLAIKRQMLRRVAMESDVKASRIPAPLNITEIGGYLNLLEKINSQEMIRQTLTSILGLPVQYTGESEIEKAQAKTIEQLTAQINELKKELEELKESQDTVMIP